MEITKCPKCGGRAYHNKGTSRTTGEPYENYKCEYNKKTGGKCDWIKWVDQESVHYEKDQDIEEYEKFQRDMREGMRIINENIQTAIDMLKKIDNPS
jgi:predicted nucleic-acid-binding Zn-ribbon protein